MATHNEPPKKKRKTEDERAEPTSMLTRSQRHKLRDTTILICSIDVSKFLDKLDADALRRTSKQNYDNPVLAERFSADQLFIYLLNNIRLRYEKKIIAAPEGFFLWKHGSFVKRQYMDDLRTKLEECCYLFERKRRMELKLEHIDELYLLREDNVERVFYGIEKYGSFRMFSRMYAEDDDIRDGNPDPNENECEVSLHTAVSMAMKPLSFFV